MSVAGVLAGVANIPYLNATACQILRRVFAHLTQGTRPSKKKRNIKDLKRLLQIATVDTNGLLVVQKTDPFIGPKRLIIVPSQILPGLVTALHLHFCHATKLQLTKLFGRYFFGPNTEAVIANVVNSCETCNALKKVPKEILLQSSTPSAEQPGRLFYAVIRRAKQKILVVRDVHSSFTTASIIPDEGHSTLRAGILNDTSLFRLNPSIFKVDNAPGFTALKDDQQLQLQGVTLDFGRVKNKNKNAVADKCIQELDLELLKLNSVGGGQISSTELQAVLRTLNQRIRHHGLSAREVLLQREQNTGEQLSFRDKLLAARQENNRKQNHVYISLLFCIGSSITSCSCVNIYCYLELAVDERCRENGLCDSSLFMFNHLYTREEIKLRHVSLLLLLL